ncbi:S8 family serine peptidase [Salinimonas chungwhensis]|uniref:S8 family serine peptidase n=1 Tax=Salinimonas chungwhensis TaxID=265425 RepID=UPI0003817A05|nr:S8 family serine peptidase [Salinimonas chungwhensis]
MTFKKHLLGSMISMAVTAAMVPSALAQQVTVPDASKLTTTGPVKAARSQTGLYIVQLRDKAGVTYAADIGELVPSNKVAAGKGNQYNAKSQKLVDYTNKLKSRQQAIANSAGDVDVIHNYVHTFNGFSAKLSDDQVEALRNNPDVVGVWEDELLKVDTANTPEFLGLTEGQGQHVSGIKGEDVIVGILDTGITPENPSFSGEGYSDPSTLEDWSGVCDPGEDDTFSCNNKVIGAQYFGDGFAAVYPIQTELGEFIGPRDADGHGSHTAGTAAGNEGVPAMKSGGELGVMSGIAPRARIAAYKVCWNSDYTTPDGEDQAGCFPSDTMAAIDQATADGVDVINYSIGGSRTDLTYPPTAAMLRATAAGVFVSVSAGNSGPAAQTIGTPAPWVTTVAASTYEGFSQTNALEVTSNGSAEQYPFVEGSITKPLAETGPVSGELVLAEPLRACYDDGATPSPLANAAEVEGKIVLIQRGDCAFTQKVIRAVQSGAKAAVIYTVEGNPITSLGGDYVGEIPGGMIGAQDGDNLAAALNSGETLNVELNASIFVPQKEEGNIMAGFSSRGPNLSTEDVIKPDITAPGVRILAATTDTPMFGNQGEQVAYLSGTSMSSPHIAGMAALLMDQHPDWSPGQVRSALMTTAYQGVTKEDGVIPADPFDFGAGHAAPVSAMEPGLTYDVGFFDYMAFMCGLDEDSFVTQESGFACSDFQAAGFSLDPSQLNYPSISVGTLDSEKTIFRTVTDVTGSGGTYTVSLEGLEGIDATVSTYDANGNLTASPDLVVTPGGVAAYGITMSKNEEAVIDQWTFGAITLESATSSVRSPIAVKPAVDIKIDVPESQVINLRRGRGNFPVQMNYSGRTSIDYAGLAPLLTTPDQVEQDPSQTFAFLGAGTTYTAWLVPEGSELARFSLRNERVAAEGADLDLYVYRCVEFSCSQIDASLNAGSDEDVIIRNPEPAADGAVGTFYLTMVHGWFVPGGVTDYEQMVWVVNGKEPNLRVSSSTRAVDNRFNRVNIMTRGLEQDSTYMGTVSFFDDDGILQGTTALEVRN